MNIEHLRRDPQAFRDQRDSAVRLEASGPPAIAQLADVSIGYRNQLDFVSGLRPQSSRATALVFCIVRMGTKTDNANGLAPLRIWVF